MAIHFKYQIVLLGGNKAAKQELRSRIELRLSELGVDHINHVAFFDATNSPADLIPGAPVVGVYFEGVATNPDLVLLSHMISNSYVIVPVVSDLGKYSASVPSILYPINGFEFHGNIDELTNACLEALNLLRRTRRLFISYRRQESSTAASQLYEHLDKSGFDVFLDTVSIRPGEPFQEVLWHRLSDTDVVLILDTPGFLDSRWTQEELAKASAMSIGLIQLVWPNQVVAARAALCEKFYLDNTMNFFNYNNSTTNHPLTDATLDQITSAVESLRARSFAARYDNLVKELKKAADDNGCLIAVQPDRHVFVSKVTGKSTATIPAVGVPDAISYHGIDQLYTKRANPDIVGTVLLYDHRNIREAWCQHLSWLDKHLPVSSVRITEVTKWLQTL